VASPWRWPCCGCARCRGRVRHRRSKCDRAALVIGGERIVPCSGLPASRRSAGNSIAWSAQLRTMWISGSLIRSRIWRSSSVSAPSSPARCACPVRR
jgi:hypothetical protein